MTEDQRDIQRKLRILRYTEASLGEHRATNRSAAKGRTDLQAETRQQKCQISKNCSKHIPLEQSLMDAGSKAIPATCAVLPLRRTSCSLRE